MAHKCITPGSVIAEQLMQAIRIAEHAPVAGARNLPVLSGFGPAGTFTEPQENVLANACRIVAESSRVYAYGGSVVMESRLNADQLSLATLRSEITVEPNASRLLSNLLVCVDLRGHQFAVTDSFAKLLLLAEPLLSTLPRLRTYARRPIFDSEFRICGPGWHPDAGILVHGPAIEAVVITPAASTEPVLQRLPYHLAVLLGGFCFRSDADLVNALAFYLTGMLINHFVPVGKPILLVDGNQPDVGKTLFTRVLSIVLSGGEPALTRYTADDDELQKITCANLRETTSSVLLYDNAKSGSAEGISSPTIESQSLAPEISLRILCHSATFRRPNDLIWAITMNETRACRDIISRGVPVQLYYEGVTESRDFAMRDPIQYATEHRLEILGELAGMIILWNQQGRPEGAQTHRCRDWARILGGILHTCGFPEFLTNTETVAATFNSKFDELAALAETVVKEKGPFLINNGNLT